MSDLVEGFKKLAEKYKSAGGKFLKFTAIETFLDFYHKEVIEKLADALKHIAPEEMSLYVQEGKPLPIPQEFYAHFIGFEDYVEKFPPGRFFEWIAEANPLVAAAIIDLGDEGVAYMLNLKQFFLDSVKAASLMLPQDVAQIPALAEESESPKSKPVKEPLSAPAPEKTLSCDKCGYTWKATAEEAAKIRECPQCGEPA